MILYKGYEGETDDYREIRGQLELQETVRALEESTGRSASTFDNPGATVRPPGVNYVIGNQAHGMLERWQPQTLARELVNQGLVSGDELTLVACWAGIPDGFA